MSSDAGSRARLLSLAGLMVLGACSDSTGPGPDARVVGLAVPATVQLDALRDSVRLSAELVFEDGRREALENGRWSGHGGETATLHSDGWVWTRGEGEFDATVSYDTLTAVTRVTVRREGRILLTFDDGWRSALTVAEPALTAAGLKATVAVIVDAVTWEAFLSLDELRQLDDAGWAFVSHSVTHADLTTLSAQELEAELADSRTWLLDRELRTGDVFIVPYHAWGDRERAAIGRHYAAARGATVDYSSPEFVAEWRPEDPYAITTLDASWLLRTEAGRADIMRRVRDAIAAGQLLDLMFHDVPPEDVDAFHALVDELVAVRDRVYTWADLWPVEEAP